VVTPAIAPTASDDDSSIIILSVEELEQIIANALRNVGCTYEELAEQARTETFQSWKAHRTWVVVRGLVKMLQRPA
jgi:hypothetical protein